MRSCDVVVVGGGPAGATCAWALGGAGADVVLLDRERFPREKPCAGWVTPAVFRAIGITPADYAAAGHTLQPFNAFRTSVMGARVHTTTFAEPVSFGILRAEFDTLLLRRIRTAVVEGTPVTSLRRQNGDWIVNDSIRTPIVVGAGGHFCPVARQSRRFDPKAVVLSRYVERRLGRDERSGISGSVPELYFCEDLEGYGWCIRKGDALNVGFGRRTGAQFREHVKGFASFLAREGKVPDTVLDWRQWRGHAYALAGVGHTVVGDGFLLIGDAAGLAARESGEGIGPAVASGLVAAEAISAADGRRRAGDFQSYAAWASAHAKSGGFASAIRSAAPASIGRALFRSPGFARHVIEQFFLRAG